MMTTENIASLAPLQTLDLPPLEMLYERIVSLDTGCEIWIGSYHRKTGPVHLYRTAGKCQRTVALWFYEYGVLPAFNLMRLCEPSACVAVVHRAVSACV